MPPDLSGNGADKQLRKRNETTSCRTGKIPERVGGTPNGIGKPPVASDTRECAAGLSIRSRDETPDSDRPERATPETAVERHLSQVGSERTT